MDTDKILTLLKLDLQIRNDAQDDYLKHLIELASELMKREGIQEENTVEYTGITVQYAAYLFRKRAGKETAMPRFLRWELNNLLISQKAREKSDTG